MAFFLSLLADGMLAGLLYSLIALAFVVVYKASRVINFALGEWAMVGSRLTALGLHGLGLGLAGSIAFACAGMAAFALAFNRLVLRRLVGQPVISLLMVTLGLGALMRGGAPLALGGATGDVRLPIPSGALAVGEVLISADKLAAAAISVACILAVSWFFQRSRAGLALRCVADDQVAAMAMGIDVRRCFALVWALVGIISVVVGVLWAAVSGGGFGMALIGLKVFPIVIIGGLDSIPGTIVAGLLVGALESLAAGYLDQHLGGGFSAVASYIALLAVLCVRPHGLFGQRSAQRV